MHAIAVTLCDENDRVAKRSDCHSAYYWTTACWLALHKSLCACNQPGPDIGASMYLGQYSEESRLRKTAGTYTVLTATHC